MDIRITEYKLIHTDNGEMYQISDNFLYSDNMFIL